MLSQLLLVSTKVDYLDSLIGAAIILFILRLITEKFVSFLRKYFCFPKKLNKFNLFMNVNADIDNEIDINQKRLSEKKQNEISALSILIGIIIAFMARASLFDLITSNPQDKLFWKEGWDLTCDRTSIQFIIGTLFTGFFLSFGSKFFHDLLDTLYQSKELKRKLQNPQTYTQNSASQVSDFVNLNSFEIAKLALVKHEKAIKKK